MCAIHCSILSKLRLATLYDGCHSTHVALEPKILPNITILMTVANVSSGCFFIIAIVCISQVLTGACGLLFCLSEKRAVILIYTRLPHGSST